MKINLRSWIPILCLVGIGGVMIILSINKNGQVLSATASKTLEERVLSLEKRVALLEKSVGSSTTKSSFYKENFVALTGGTSEDLYWKKVDGSDFSLDLSLYGKNVSVSWQGWLSGSGEIRLYDATNHRVVDFSAYSAEGNDGVRSFYSRDMSIWRGQNQYYIEIKSFGGMVSLSSPRLKIVTK